jgi:hypothetical protein
MTFKTHCQISKGDGRCRAVGECGVFVVAVFCPQLFVRHGAGFKVSLPASGHAPDGRSKHWSSRSPAMTCCFSMTNPLPWTSWSRPCARPSSERGPRDLIIKADKQVSIGTVAEIMSAANRAGITTVNMAARPEACREPRRKLSCHEARSQAVLRAGATDAVDSGRLHRGVRVHVSFRPGFRASH